MALSACLFILFSVQIKPNKTPFQQALRKVAPSGTEVATYGTIAYYSGNCKDR
jgi:hypothetical protein